MDIYGKVCNIVGERSFIPFRYQGQYEDEETGLYYNRFRYYSPDSGTYISQDPIRLMSKEANFYAYVHDVNKQVDQLGLIPRAGHISFIGDALHPKTITPDNLGGTFEIQATGSYQGDKLALYDKTKNPNIWGADYNPHHVSYDPKTNIMTMQLVHNDYHSYPHIGGVKDFKKDTGFKYDSPEAKAEANARKKLNH